MRLARCGSAAPILGSHKGANQNQAVAAAPRAAGVRVWEITLGVAGHPDDDRRRSVLMLPSLSVRRTLICAGIRGQRVLRRGLRGRYMNVGALAVGATSVHR
jgi:hypothetical protein